MNEDVVRALAKGRANNPGAKLSGLDQVVNVSTGQIHKSASGPRGNAIIDFGVIGGVPAEFTRSRERDDFFFNRACFFHDDFLIHRNQYTAGEEFSGTEGRQVTLIMHSRSGCMVPGGGARRRAIGAARWNTRRGTRRALA